MHQSVSQIKVKNIESGLQFLQYCHQKFLTENIQSYNLTNNMNMAEKIEMTEVNMG